LRIKGLFTVVKVKNGCYMLSNICQAARSGIGTKQLPTLKQIH